MTPLLSSALLRAQSDERLVELAAAGHDRAFEAIVERYRRPLMRYLRRLLSEALAEDVVQATLINAWSSLRSGTDVHDLRPWLYRIAHNAAINALKKVGEAMEEVPESAGGFATEPAAELERRDEMLHALSSIAALPSRQRAALLAVAVDGRAHAEVAEELGLTDGAVRQLVHRARTTLRTAATAVTPLPLLNAIVASAGDSTVARVAEVAAGAGAASVSLKAGAAAVIATGALVTGGPQVAKVVHPSQKRSAPEAHSATPLSPASGPGGGGSFAAPAVAPAADRSGSSSGSSGSGKGKSARKQRRRGKGADRDRSAPSANTGRRERDATEDRRGRGDGEATHGNRGPATSGRDRDDDGPPSASSGRGTPGSGGHGADDAAGQRDGGASDDDTGSAGGGGGDADQDADDELVVTRPQTTTMESGGQSGPTTTTETQTTTVVPAATTPSAPPSGDSADPRTTTGGDSSGSG